MPVIAFFVVVASALLAFLFVADATLQKSSLPTVTTDRVGLPERWHSDTIKVLTSTPAPAPDMTSKGVLAAQPKVTPAAREEAPREHFMPSIDSRPSRRGDKFSI